MRHRPRGGIRFAVVTPAKLQRLEDSRTGTCAEHGHGAAIAIPHQELRDIALALAPSRSSHAVAQSQPGFADHPQVSQRHDVHAADPPTPPECRPRYQPISGRALDVARQRANGAEEITPCSRASFDKHCFVVPAKKRLAGAVQFIVWHFGQLLAMQSIIGLAIKILILDFSANSDPVIWLYRDESSIK